MSTSKAITNNPITNNGGTVKSGGTLSRLNTVEHGNTPTPNIITTNKLYGRLIPTNTLSEDVGMGRDNQTSQHYNINQYTSESLDIDFVTGQPSGYRTSYDDFTQNSNLKSNNFTAYRFATGGNPSRYNYSSGLLTQPSTHPLVNSVYIQALNIARATITTADDKRGLSIFTGRVSPSGNALHNKVFTVKEYAGATLLHSHTYDLPTWGKLNLNLPETTTSVVIDACNCPALGFSAGTKPLLEQATTQSRTLTVNGIKSNPLHLTTTPNLTLTGQEKSFKITASGDPLMLMFREVDVNNSASDVVYQIVPTGASLIYYPVYDNIVLGEVEGKPLAITVYT